MKRKRGHKKGKKKKKLPLVEQELVEIETLGSPNHEIMSVNSGDSSDFDEENDDKVGNEVESESLKKVEKPVEKPVRFENIRVDGVIERPPPTAVYGRVKVKLKASKPAIEAPILLTEAPVLRNENDKVTQQISVDKQQVQGGVVEVSEKGADNGNSLPESKKCGGIKIVSSKGWSPKESGASGSSLEGKREVEDQKLSNQEPKLAKQGARYAKRELETSLEVITKVMKMEASEPFNAPVDPIGLGIPDYFDIIDTPMDFGTIRKNLESGAKYMNSEDVYKDVQHIWNNCLKYNNKGDYVMDLMKRVKKNFMKYWVAYGLYTEQTRKTNGGENIHMDEATTSGFGKKLKRGKGFKRHKDDCMCAICIMKRRRREREAREAQEARGPGAQVASPQTEHTMTGLRQEFKQEENSIAESPRGGDTSSNMDTSQDVDPDAEMEDGEDTRQEVDAPQYNGEQEEDVSRVGFRDKSDKSGDLSEKSQRSDKGETDSYSHVEERTQDESGSKNRLDAEKQLSAQREGSSGGHLQQRHELLELEKTRQRLRLVETFRDLENPMLLGLCGTLFPNKSLSVWNGPNSLVRCQRSRHRNDIHEAVALFMTTPSSKSASSQK